MGQKHVMNTNNCIKRRRIRFLLFVPDAHRLLRRLLTGTRANVYKLIGVIYASYSDEDHPYTISYLIIDWLSCRYFRSAANTVRCSCETGRNSTVNYVGIQILLCSRQKLFSFPSGRRGLIELIKRFCFLLCHSDSKII